mgnify:CR=1 FL=1
MNANNGPSKYTYNLLFFSRKCSDSISLIRLLKNENLLMYFRLICVDDKLGTNQIPPEINKVPTMIVKTIKYPPVGKNAFLWTSSMKHLNKMKVVEQNQKNIYYMMANMGQQTGPLDCTKEMIGFSDGYAYTKEDGSHPHNFVDASQKAQSIIFTAPEQNKMKKDEQKKRILEMEGQRKKQDSVFEHIYKEKQYDAIARTEMEKQKNTY